ncbi:MAG: hypothetical protein LBB52_07360, partial [Desulfovibrio sp.]|nr:hypothetical protein [Desulfovibrio sp.]
MAAVCCGYFSAIAGLPGCTADMRHMEEMTVDTSTWQTCAVGRFLIDLPLDASKKYTARIWGEEIIRRSDLTPESARQEAMRAMEKYKAVRHDLIQDGTQFIDMFDFAGGGIAVHRWQEDYTDSMSNMDCYFVSQDVEMDSPRIDAIKGSVTLKNLTKLRFSRNGSLINGSGLVLRVDNCHISGSTAYVTNSTFRSSGFLGENSKAMYFENCKLLDGSSIL